MRVSFGIAVDRRVAGLLLAVLTPACATTQRAANAAATATARSVVTATNATADAVMSILPFVPPTGPDAQAAQIREHAGPAHFRNESFGEGRDEMRVQRVEFTERREKLVSNDFREARNRFRGGGTTPHSGPIIGPNTDPATIRAILLAASAAGGVVPTGIQPVLATLLPAFGN